MSITINVTPLATGSVAASASQDSVNLTVQSGIGPVGPQGALVGGTGIDASFANGNSTVSLNATLSDLTDVSASAPSAGQVLEWNGTQWAPAADTTLNLAAATPSNLGTAAAGAGTAAARDDHVHAMPGLGDLTDITLGSPSPGEVLTYNGSAWVAAADSTNLTGYATESFVNSAVANLVDSSPAALDTLNELAAALGDDANFAANVTASLSGKAAANHTHDIADVTGLQSELDGKAETANLATVATSGNYSDLSGIPSEFTPAAHNHTSANITDFATAAAANAPIQTVNNATGDIVIANGTGITLTENGSTLTLAAALPPSNLADLADVSGSPSANQALIYNGTEWQPGNIPAGTTINSLSGDLTLANGTGLTLTENGSTLTLATNVSYNDLSDLPTLGTAAATDASNYATAAQGTLADSAVQPGDLATVATTGSYSDLSGIPSEFTPSAHTHTAGDVTDFGTAAAANAPLQSLNSLTGTLTIAGSGGTTVTDAGSTITVASTAPPTNLADLSDVSNSSPSTNQVLKWNGSEWAPAADATNGTGGGGGGYGSLLLFG